MNKISPVQQTFKKPRFDSSGKSIERGGKAHHIHFSQKVHTVYIVENWKLYNIDKGEDDDSCSCILL